MLDPHDTVTAELPHLGTPGDLAPEQLGDIARSLMGLPPQAPGAQHRALAPLPDWRLALDAAIAADPQGKAGVALRLGVSRPYVSRVTTGHMPVAPARFVARVRAVYMQVQCPHLGRALPPGQCLAYAQRGYADVGADEVDHWRACRRCPANPITRAPSVRPDGAGATADATTTPETAERNEP